MAISPPILLIVLQDAEGAHRAKLLLLLVGRSRRSAPSIHTFTPVACAAMSDSGRGVWHTRADKGSRCLYTYSSMGLQMSIAYESMESFLVKALQWAFNVAAAGTRPPRQQRKGRPLKMKARCHRDLRRC